MIWGRIRAFALVLGLLAVAAVAVWALRVPIARTTGFDLQRLIGVAAQRSPNPASDFQKFAHVLDVNGSPTTQAPQPGDIVRYMLVLPNHAQGATLQDQLSGPQSYVAGSLQLPPGWTQTAPILPADPFSSGGTAHFEYTGTGAMHVLTATVPGAGPTFSRQFRLSDLYCGEPPEAAAWASISFSPGLPAGTTFVLTNSTGQTETITIAGGQTTYPIAVLSDAMAGGGMLTIAGLNPASSPLTISLSVTSDRQPQICYRAKVDKCGTIGNTATLTLPGHAPGDTSTLSAATGPTSVTGRACGAEAILKVCKVAGEGVEIGDRFVFSALTGGERVASVSVPAGPAPGGSCNVLGTFPEGSLVTVDEEAAAGTSVESIAASDPARMEGAPNLTAGSADIRLGSGVTEVTFVNVRRTGFLEICKTEAVAGSFSFTVQGVSDPVVVPAGACSPPIEVQAGRVRVTEALPAGVSMTGCSALPANRQVNCDTATATAEVEVVRGDVSTQSILTVTNAANPPPPPPGNGKLLVTKKVATIGPIPAASTSFQITVTCVAPGGATTTHGPLTFTSNGGQSSEAMTQALSGLTEGSVCTLTEATPTAPYPQCHWIIGAPAQGEIIPTAPGVASASVWNYYTCAEPGKSTLFIKKQYDHPQDVPYPGGNVVNFPVTVTCTNPANGATVTHNTVFTNNSSAGLGSMITVPGVPIGWQCKVDENLAAAAPPPATCQFDPETYPVGDTATILPPPAFNGVLVVNHLVCPE
jgi:hypothetical protein